MIVIDQKTQRDQGRKAQLANIAAAKAVADVVRTCLGPRAMLKMILSNFGIVMTNDGNAILRELEVTHPAAKSMIELSRTQDEEVGDGTTSVIILAGEILSMAEPWIQRDMHPIVINRAFLSALSDGLECLERFSKNVGESRADILQVIETSIATKYIAKWSGLFCNIALDAVSTIVTTEHGRKEIDLKRNLQVVKIPGGEIGDSYVLSGVCINKDVTHAGMRRRIENPRILILDCNLEYKKGESQTDVELERPEQFEEMLRLEEQFVKNMCDEILQFKPDLVITEKGFSDLAQHYFVQAGVTGLRRFRSGDAHRIARACGARIVHRTDEIQESDIGTGCGLFEVRQIADDYWVFLTECKDPKACTVVLRGPGKDLLNEIERNLQDAFHVVRNILLDPRLVPGGGAIEMAVSGYLNEKAKSVRGVEQYPYRAISLALEVIPRTLAANCGAKTVRAITQLRAKHATDPVAFQTLGIDGLKGEIADMKNLGIWEPLSVKAQIFKTAVEFACMLLRVDDVVSGIKKEGAARGGPDMSGMEGMM